MATFRRRGKGWEYRVRYVDPLTGNKTERSKGGFRTKKEAEYEAAELYTDVSDGLNLKANSNILFKDYADIWFEDYKRSIKETSIRSRLAYLNNLKKRFSNIRLRNMTLKIYQKELDSLGKEYKKNSISSMNQIMQMIFKQAVEDKYFKFNPIERAKIPRFETEEEKIKFWDMHSINKFTEYCTEKTNIKRSASKAYLNWEKERDLAIFYLMLYGGLRIGEACALYTTDYYPITKEIDINKTLGSALPNQVKSSWKIYPPKTKNAYRLVPLPEVAYKQVEKWLKLRKEYIAFFSNIYHESHYLFCQKDGSPLTTRDVRGKFSVIVNKLELPKITPHGLRHTYTALQIQAGIDVKSLQMILGHADIKTTLNIYAHLTEQKKKETINRFDLMLKNLESGAKAGQSTKTAKNE
ncbi:tyrosine-type recombinase/integrase [Enterococcus italicus]|uniref:site-specific integrase n=1 Tax=Enterococcus italicus TaxID=246144 RepID=UPI002072E56D|nr:site-specific integrase [Enterococcus italicus]MCM6930300.1 tyrosine-type recombinase/integrase [Enterococcus italicus]